MRVSRNGEPCLLASSLTDFSQEDYFEHYHPMSAIANPRMCHDPSCGAIVSRNEPCVACEMRSSLDGFQESKGVNGPDIDAQSTTLSVSPVIIFPSESPIASTSTTPWVQSFGNYYSNPIRNPPFSMSTDQAGVLWIVFPYSKNKEVKYQLSLMS
jgi:hypothetical protein